MTGSVPSVVLTSCEAVKEAFLDKPNDFADRPKLYSCRSEDDINNTFLVHCNCNFQNHNKNRIMWILI